MLSVPNTSAWNSMKLSVDTVHSRLDFGSFTPQTFLIISIFWFLYYHRRFTKNFTFKSLQALFLITFYIIRSHFNHNTSNEHNHYSWVLGSKIIFVSIILLTTFAITKMFFFKFLMLQCCFFVKKNSAKKLKPSKHCMYVCIYQEIVFIPLGLTASYV